MSKKAIFMVSLLLILASINFLAQQSIKIKPILGKHSYTLESTDTGYGVTKHKLCLERLNGNNTELYLPSGVPLTVNAVPFNEPEPSGKLNINSQQTADGFLFLANGPGNNNFHLHCKKNSSDNSSYSIEINLTQGNKYKFSVNYLPNGYLLIKGQGGDYYQMLDAVTSNNYFLEALSHLDDEFSKYSGNDQLEWWAQAVAGLFLDLVDVEAIALLVNSAGFYSSFYECSAETGHCDLAWICNDIFTRIALDSGDFVVMNVAQQQLQKNFILGGCDQLCAMLVAEGFFEDKETCLNCCHEGTVGDVCYVGPSAGDPVQLCIDMCDNMFYWCKFGCIGGHIVDLPACMAGCFSQYNRCVTDCKLR